MRIEPPIEKQTYGDFEMRAERVPGETGATAYKGVAERSYLGHVVTQLNVSGDSSADCFATLRSWIDQRGGR